MGECKECWKNYHKMQYYRELNVEMLEALEDVFELLETELPQWYLRKHYNLMNNAIQKAKGE